MLDEHDRSATPDRSMVVYELPAHIVKGRCSSCGHDLNDLAETIINETEPKTYHCTGCGIELATDKIEHRVWRCGECHRPLVKYGQDKHCSGCGRELIYPKGGGHEQEE